MTKIKRYISVLILAAFTVMLLAGCGSPMVTNNSSTMKSKYKLNALDVLETTTDSDAGYNLVTLILKYARYVAGFSSDADNMLKSSYLAFDINDFESTAADYWFESSDLTEVVTILETLNSWVENGYGSVRFIVYQAVTASGDVTYVGAVSITPAHRDTDDDEPASSCASKESCTCAEGECMCESDCQGNCG